MGLFSKKKKKTERHISWTKGSYDDKEWYDVRVDGMLVRGGNKVSYEEAQKTYLKWISGNFEKVKTEVIQETTIEL